MRALASPHPSGVERQRQTLGPRLLDPKHLKSLNMSGYCRRIEQRVWSGSDSRR